jgi:hypothetical protein
MKILHLFDPAHGWINITFGQEPDGYTIIASDVPNDCLRDLAAATARLLTLSVQETVKFPLEPEFVICQLSRHDASVRIQLYHPMHNAPVFEDTFPLTAFAQRLRFELLRIEPLYSNETNWTQPYPYQEVADLKT